jgi:hypothetical protein
MPKPGDDLYGGDGPTVAEEPAPADQKPEAGEEKEQQTFLLNKDIDPSFKVGEEMVVKIVAVHDKEYEVEYAHGPEKDEAAPKAGGDEGMAPEAPAGEMGGGSPDSMYG